MGKQEGKKMPLSPPPHVLFFPLPMQSPTNSFLKLAELLCSSGSRDIHVTFLNTHHIHRRLLRHAGIHRRFAAYTNFRFETIPDGLPDDHPRSGDFFIEMMTAMEVSTKPLLKGFLTSDRRSYDSGGKVPPVTCMIAEGIFGFALDVAEEAGVPLIHFETIGPAAIWTYLCLPKLIQAGELPFQGNDLESKITNVAGMENFLRRRDLPSFCRSDNLTDTGTQMALVLREVQQLPRAQGLIVNTFEDLDELVLSYLRTICPNLYAVGPIHLHFKARAQATPELVVNETSFSNSLWEEDRSCLAWLDAQPSRSVIYISIGSYAFMTPDQYREFWHGLVDSGKRFLWVQRPGSVEISKTGVPGPPPPPPPESSSTPYCIVEWAPQQEVLAHPAVGGFLTHSGWNSTLESIVEGVPMICWPSYVDQQVNSRFVSEVWRIGIDMKDSCSRGVIAKMVREVMEVRRNEFIPFANKFAKLSGEAVSEGGSSYSNLDRLIQDIRLMSLPASPHSL